MQFFKYNAIFELIKNGYLNQIDDKRLNFLEKYIINTLLRCIERFMSVFVDGK